MLCIFVNQLHNKTIFSYEHFIGPDDCQIYGQKFAFFFSSTPQQSISFRQVASVVTVIAPLFIISIFISPHLARSHRQDGWFSRPEMRAALRIGEKTASRSSKGHVVGWGVVQTEHNGPNKSLCQRKGCLA